MTDGITITPLMGTDRDDWRPLWNGYLDFYRTRLDPAVTDGLWDRLLDPAQPTKGLLARDGAGNALGLCHYVLHQNTWSLSPVCYLEDLFTAPAARGRGVGAALIGRVVALGRSQGWDRVYWMTAEDNATARALYDRVAGGRDGFVRYVIRP